jgi:hypothetical protein
MDRTLAKLNFEGKIRAFLENAGGVDQQALFLSDTMPIDTKRPRTSSVMMDQVLISPLNLANASVPPGEAGNAATRAADAAGDWVAEVRFGFPQRDGQPPPGSSNKEGRMLVAQLGPDEYLLTGIVGAVFFHRPGYLPGIRMQILTAEEGYYTPGTMPAGTEEWHRIRILNGDETDRGIQFADPTASAHVSGRQTAAAGGDPVPPASSEHGPLAVRITLGRF